jgi:hypothetical protein
MRERLLAHSLSPKKNSRLCANRSSAAYAAVSTLEGWYACRHRNRHLQLSTCHVSVRMVQAALYSINSSTGVQVKHVMKVISSRSGQHYQRQLQC